MGRREIPLDPTAGPVEAFAYALRQLRVRAGTPSYRALSRKAGYSASALSAAASGSTLPSLKLALAYAGGCGGRREEWEARWLRASQAVTGVRPELVTAPVAAGSPDDPVVFGAVSQPLAADDPHQVGGYRLRARIGCGGIGRVFLADDPSGRAVAMKVVWPELAGDMAFRLRFQRQVAAARRVRGPFTATVLDADVTGPRPWLATTYVHGPSLHEAVTWFGPLPIRSLWPLVARIAQALQAVQAAGLVHRDLSPSNVLLTLGGPRLVDFGIAPGCDAANRTRPHGQAGVPRFVAPEHVLGKRLTFAADVFVLGALIVFAATGRSPFGEGLDATVLYRVVHEPPRLCNLPPELRKLAAGCLDKNPQRRLELTKVVDICRTVGGSGSTPRLSVDWLPQRYVAEIRRFGAAAPPPSHLPLPSRVQPA